MPSPLSREITQRELRNESGEIVRRLDEGDSFFLARNGVAWVRSLHFGATGSFALMPLSPCSSTRPLSMLRSSARTATAWAHRSLLHVAERVAHKARGIIDTSVVIDLEKLDPAVLPVELAVTSLTMAELAADISTRRRTPMSVRADRTDCSGQRPRLTHAVQQRGGARLRARLRRRGRQRAQGSRSARCRSPHRSRRLCGGSSPLHKERGRLLRPRRRRRRSERGLCPRGHYSH